MGYRYSLCPAPLNAPAPKSIAERREKKEGSKVGLFQRLLPLPWQLWPAEARLLMGLAGFWSVAGLVVLASASWWVALREMGDGGFYLKRQAIWLMASWSLLGITISTNLRRWLRWSGPGLWMGCLLIAATLVMGTKVTVSYTHLTLPTKNEV